MKATEDFNVNEHSDITHSGPFVNPENLMNNI